MNIDRPDTKILTDVEVRALTTAVQAMMGPEFAAFASVFDVSAEDSIRFRAVAAQCSIARDSLALSVEGIATKLRVPQYRLKAIERTSLHEVRGEILQRYATFLALDSWLCEWAAANTELATKLQLTGAKDRASKTPTMPRQARSTSPKPKPSGAKTGPLTGQQICRFKVTLRGVRPPVWRRMEVPAAATLFDLHRILQVAMGWTDSHLHQFECRGVRYGTSDPEFGVRRVNERRTRIADVVRAPKDRLTYEYDFGDSWEHDVVLEATVLAEPDVRYPRVLAGKGACPPEDVGGVPGYAMFLEAIADPSHPEHGELLEWCGGAFDPHTFEIDALNRRLHARNRRRSPEARA